MLDVHQAALSARDVMMYFNVFDSLSTHSQYYSKTEDVIYLKTEPSRSHTTHLSFSIETSMTLACLESTSN